MKTSDVNWLSGVIAAARAAGIREVEVETPNGRVRFTTRHRDDDRSSLAAPGRPLGYEEQMQLAEWFEEGRLCVVRSPTVGVWRAAVGPLTVVSKGAQLGEIRSAGIVVPVRSPIDGRTAVVYVESGQPVQYGQLLASVIKA